ncbi:MAG TPA: glycoside hydrolase family 76 protein, partial [Verrucomicrobiae bacterium]
MPLPSGSYNQDVVVENTAPAPLIPGGYTTASMDAGVQNSGTSWYEEGYNSTAPTTGLPAPGTTFGSQSSSSHFYKMAPSYTTNNAILLDTNLTSATFTLTAPAAYKQLSFLESGGHNGVTLIYTVHHLSGNADTGTTNIPDWFSNGTNVAWTANGRVDVGTFGLENVNSGDPQLYSLDITLANTTSPVTSIDFKYVSGVGHGAIMAVSGSTGGNFTPITVTGYNEDIVIENDAAAPGALTGVTTATMDTGVTNTMTTWYEMGYIPSAPQSGLPTPGSTITNISAPDHLYTLASSYNANNAILLTTNAAPVKLTLNSSSNYSALSFLVAAGDGPVRIGCRILHANGLSESNDFIVPDWFSESPVAFAANGRVDLDNKVISSLNAINPCLYAADVSMANNSPVTTVTLSWLTGSGNANAVIFAISGGTSVLPLAEDDFNANSAAAASIQQQWYNDNGLYNSTGWWNAANCLEALETVAVADNQPQYLGVLSNTFALNSSGNFLDGYYDDEGWWANAWIRGYDLTGNTNFLKMAKTIFADMTNGWSPADCGGGIWWDKSETYKNSIANELFILTAIRLHQRTPVDTGANNYFFWATNGWTWFHNIGLINSESLINDGLSNCTNNGASTFTYNQGV